MDSSQYIIGPYVIQGVVPVLPLSFHFKRNVVKKCVKVVYHG